MQSRLPVLGLALVIAGVIFLSAPTAQASATGAVHCVKYGETLYGIAGRYGTSAGAIAHANGLYNPNYIRAGMCLRIPAGYGYHPGYTPPVYGHYPAKPVYGHYPAKPVYNPPHYGYTPKPVYNPPHYGKGRVHCVAYGETLYGIAWRYGVSAWSIAHANGLGNPNWIRAGSCLVIP